MPEAIDAEVARLKLAAMGITLDADDARAARVRLLLAARHLSDAEDGRRDGEAAAARTVAPYGSWASPIDVELVAGRRRRPRPRPRSTATTSTGSRAGRPRAAGGRCSVTASTARPASSRPPRSTSATGSTSTAAARTPWTAGGRRLVAADGRLYRLDPDGAAEPVALTPEGPWRYADLRFDPRPRAAYAVRETHDAAREQTRCSSRTSSSPSRSTGRTAPAASSSRARTSSRRRGRRPTARARLDRVGPPGHALGRDPAAGRRRRAPTGRSARPRTVAGGPGISVVQPAWSPAGVLHAVSDETGWWNLYAFDGPDGIDGAGRNLAPMDAELGEPAWVFGAARYAFLADGAILAVARADGRDGSLRIEPDGDGHAPRPAVHGGRRAPRRRRRRGRRDRRPGRGAGASSSASTPRPARCAACSPASFRRPIDPASCPSRSRSRSATPSGATARALYFAPTNPSFRGPDGELPPLIVESHGGPTGAAYVRAVARPGVLHLARDRRRRRRLPRLAGLRAPVPRRAQGPVGDRRRRGLRRGRPVPRRARRRRPGAARDPGRQRRRLHDARRAHLPARGVRGRHQPLRHRGPRADPRRRPQVRVALRRGPARRRGPRRAARVFRERSPIHYLDRVRAPMLIFQGLDDRVVPPSQLDAMEAAFEPRGIPYVAMRFEGEGHGFRRRETAAGDLRGRARVPRPGVRVHARRRHARSMEIRRLG